MGGSKTSRIARRGREKTHVWGSSRLQFPPWPRPKRKIAPGLPCPRFRAECTYRPNGELEPVSDTGHEANLIQVFSIHRSSSRLACVIRMTNLLLSEHRPYVSVFQVANVTFLAHFFEILE